METRSSQRFEGEHPDTRRFAPIIPWSNPPPIPWDLWHQFMGTTAIGIALRSWFVHYDNQGRDIKRQLLRHPDGRLTFLNGTPIRAGELQPGVTYDIIEKPR